MFPRTVFEKQEREQPRPAAEPAPAPSVGTRDIRSAGNQAVQALRTPGLEAFGVDITVDETPVDQMSEPQVRAEIETYDQWIQSQKQSSPLENRVQKRLKALRGRLDALIPGMEIFETSYDVTVDNTPVEQMKLHEILDEIHGYERWIPRQILTSPKKIAIEQRLPLLRRQRDVLEAGPKAAGQGNKHGDKHRAAGASGLYAPKPRSLTDPDLDPRQMSKAERDRELDAIAQYLPTNPPKAEIEKLRKAQALLLDASEHHDRKQDEQVRQAELTKALTPAGQDTPKGATAEQIDEAFAMLESVVPDPNRPGVSVVVTHGLAIPVAEEDVRAEKAWLTAKYGELADIYSGQMMQVHSGWAAQVDANEAHPLIHGLAWLQSDAEDPGNVDAARNVAIVLRTQVHENLNKGHFREAVRVLGILERHVHHWAGKEATYERELGEGAGKWLLATEIYKLELEILVLRGAGGKQGVLRQLMRGETGVKALAIAGAELTVATTAAGAVGAGTASVVNQAVSGPVSGWKTLADMGVGGGEGFTVGGGVAIGAVLNELFEVNKARGLMKFLRAAGAGTTAGTVVGGTSAAMEGKSVKKGAATGGVSGGLTAVASVGAGELTAGLGPEAERAGQTGAGFVGGGVGTYVVTGDKKAAAQSAIMGAATTGALHETAPEAPAGEPSDRVPVHIDDDAVASTQPVPAPTSREGSPTTPDGRSPTLPGPSGARAAVEPSDRVPVHIDDDAVASTQPVPTPATREGSPTTPDGRSPTLPGPSGARAAVEPSDRVPVHIDDDAVASTQPVPAPATREGSPTTPDGRSPTLPGPSGARAAVEPSDRVPVHIDDDAVASTQPVPVPPEAATPTPPAPAAVVGGPRPIEDPAEAAAVFRRQYAAAESGAGRRPSYNATGFRYRQDWETAHGIELPPTVRDWHLPPAFIDRDGVIHVSDRVDVDDVVFAWHPVPPHLRVSRAGEPPAPGPPTSSPEATTQTPAAPAADRPDAHAMAREEAGHTQPGYARGPTPIAEPVTGTPFPGARSYAARDTHYVKVRVPERDGFRTVNIAPSSRSEDLVAWVIENEAQAVAASRGAAIHFSLEEVQSQWATAGGDGAPPSLWITRGGKLHLNGHRIRAAGLIWAIR